MVSSYFLLMFLLFGVSTRFASSQDAIKIPIVPGSFVSTFGQYMGTKSKSFRQVTNLQDGLKQLSTQVHDALWKGKQTAYACENFNIFLTCPLDFKIQISNAMYGHQSQDRCDYVKTGLSETQDIGDLTCKSNVTDTVISLCDGQPRCQFLVKGILFGSDPCPGTYKYLQVDYFCKKDKGSRLVYGCRDHTVMLTCSLGQNISVKSAYFGRQPDSGRCVIAGSPYLPSTDCRRDVKEFVATQCDGQRQCGISVKRNNNKFATTTCSSKRTEYLEVEFACEEKAQCPRKTPDTRPDPGYQGMGYFSALRWIDILKMIHEDMVAQDDN